MDGKSAIRFGGGAPNYGLTGRPIKNAKVPKKVRNIAQNAE